ncbi:hypothetical protein O6H91_02G032500 [Diphasiastrum complanatum]|uniref:Uncharacterized protein n=1 Tax=Diphasiastrum complanatum TaxID=34168 RepID=A0ACC2EE07_DIPCM|nr:hypothetical protein O6H91_02G032500 [Diphasiastrum complanatum]
MQKSEVKVETVEVKAVLHCKGCYKKFRKAIANIEEVHNVSYEEKTKKFTLTGKFDPQEVIKALRKTRKQIEVLKPKETDETKPEKCEACKHDCCSCKTDCDYWRNDNWHCRNDYSYWRPDYCWCQSQTVCLLPQNRLTTYGFSEDNPNNCSFM